MKYQNNVEVYYKDNSYSTNFQLWFRQENKCTVFAIHLMD